MNAGFIVTSAINTRFGVFSSDERLLQTIDTINSITDRCPDAYIALLEMSGDKLAQEHHDKLSEVTDVVIDFSATAAVREIYLNPNWDVVKSATEMMCFRRGLGVIKTLERARGVDRWFKLSGRYLLNDDFDLPAYDHSELSEKIVFARAVKSQFAPATTGGVTMQFMSRLWSFPAPMISNIESMFLGMGKCFNDIVQKGGYIDIEHLLYLYSLPNLRAEISPVGVEGLLGPNGSRVRD